MKYLFFLIVTIGLFGCNQPSDQPSALEKRIDSLEAKLLDAYKPGFGEFMSAIQAHHAKLWFAGLHQNWKLATFEVNEIMELMEDIQKYRAERKESKVIGMIHPALDSVKLAIEQQNAALFKSSFSLLTNTCNNCHRQTDFEINVVKIPDMQIFSNQDFKRLP